MHNHELTPHHSQFSVWAWPKPSVLQLQIIDNEAPLELILARHERNGEKRLFFCLDCVAVAELWTVHTTLWQKHEMLNGCVTQCDNSHIGHDVKRQVTYQQAHLENRYFLFISVSGTFIAVIVFGVNTSYLWGKVWVREEKNWNCETLIW